ncbi:MAG: PKD domain-containing protein [Saprospiraceae bacterium]
MFSNQSLQGAIACLLLVCCCALSPLGAQSTSCEIIARPDTFCIQAGESTAGLSVFDNDDYFGTEPQLIQPVSSGCVRINADGSILVLTADPNGQACCGEQPPLFYSYNCAGMLTEAAVFVTIKCDLPKPDCSLLDLDALRINVPDPAGEGTITDCIAACENSTAVYYTAYQPGFTYSWTAVNGTILPSGGGGPAEVSVSWGSLGPLTSLTRYRANAATGFADTLTYCVELTAAPVADFNSTGVSCLGQATDFFDASSGAASWYWEFGDGGTATAQHPSHTYLAPGIYNVTLTVTAAPPVNQDGSFGCCCSDTIVKQIEIDPLPGPDIYCISTLCEGDATTYWTDADCSSYIWTATAADGSSVVVTPLTAAGDSVAVTWGSGPSGTLSFAVSGCTTTYCNEPTIVTVPIIPSNGQIGGPVQVCAGTTHTYQLPKWMSVAYDWTVTGGTVVGTDSASYISVRWDTPGTGTITADYGSDFLAGLRPHAGNDCFGSATLNVEVLGDFSIQSFNGNTACIQGSSFFTSSGTYAPGATFDWTVSPAFPLSTVSGSSFANINWSGAPGPGTYTVTATPSLPGAGDYCVASRSIVIEVIATPPADGITGELEYCPGENFSYEIVNPQPGFQYFWTVIGGTLQSGQFGSSVVIEWTDPAGGTLSVTPRRVSPIFCQGLPISISVSAITFNDPLAIVSAGPACINQLGTYSLGPVQPDEATYAWAISPDSAGTVLSGGNSPNIMVQWNNSNGVASLTATVSLCGDVRTVVEPILLNVPDQPVISQSNDLCPGVSAVLSVSGGPFTAYLWSTGATSPTITITTGGAYSVETTDSDGCVAVAAIVPQTLPPPIADISSGDPLGYCVTNAGGPTGQIVTIVAQDAGYTFAWYCNGVLQTGISGASFVHDVLNTPGNFAYFAIVTDNSTGCQATTNTVVVDQEICTGGGNGPGGCTAPFFTFTPTAVNQTPDCDVVNLSANVTAPVTSVAWTLPIGATIVSGTATSPNLSVQLPRAACFSIRCRAYAPDVNNPTDSCFRTAYVSACAPIVADFEWADDCGTISFTNTSATLTALGTSLTGESWDFGDGSPVSVASDPSHAYASPGTYTVTLTATSSDGCQSVKSQVVTVGPNLSAAVIAPDSVCVGEAVLFSQTAVGAIRYGWDFGDASSFVGKDPQHAYAVPATYAVTLTVEDAYGCTQTVVKPLVVLPAPNSVTISGDPGRPVCSGTSVVLSVPAQAGITYTWSGGGVAAANQLTVTASGSYAVALITPNGCLFSSDTVDIEFLDAPVSVISGSNFICGSVTTTLIGAAFNQAGYAYVWRDAGGVVGSGTTLDLTAGVLNSPYTFQITDANGCTATSSPFVVQAVAAPTVTISALGGLCAGDGTLLTATAAGGSGNYAYRWSDGTTGPTITTGPAGPYTVYVTDLDTGCGASGTETVNPLPDLCIVPTGCYTACRPEEICGPDGPGYQYQWSFNGAPLPGATGRCLTPNLTGSYSLAVTDGNGCRAVSDSLMLELIDCGDCTDVVTHLDPLGFNENGDCCYELNDLVLPAGIYAIQVTVSGADVIPDLSTLTSGLQLFPVSTTSFQLATNPLGNEIPAAALTDVIELCLTNVSLSQQTIVFDYLDINYDVYCSDTLKTDCADLPDCLYVESDTLYCGDDKQLIFSGTFCNPLGSLFDVGYIQLLPNSPAAVGTLPLGYTPPSPLAPGDCVSFSFIVNLTTGLPGDSYCYTAVAHSADPLIDPAALCCNLGKEYCLPIPDCEPCDDLGVGDIIPQDGPGEECCYVISLFNNVTDPVLTCLEICPPAGIDLSAFTGLGSGWIVGPGTGPGSIKLTPTAGVLPTGVFNLPELCLDEVQQTDTELIIKWLAGEEVVCRDTFNLFCKPDCGYLEQEVITCENNQYVWKGNIVNNALYPVSSAYIKFDPASGLSAYNQTITFPAPLNTGDAAFVDIVIGSPAGPGDTVCFTVILHEEDDNDLHLNCCEFEACIVMPNCLIEKCVCNEGFVQLVKQGILANFDPVNSFTATFNPVSSFAGCDSIAWYVRTTGPLTWVGTGYNFPYTFPAPGDYQVCMHVFRTDDDGAICDRRVCRNYSVVQTQPAVVPNPSNGLFQVYPVGTKAGDVSTLKSGDRSTYALSLYDLSGRQLRFWAPGSLTVSREGGLRLDVSDLPAGVYLIRGTSEASDFVVKAVIR